MKRTILMTLVSLFLSLPASAMGPKRIGNRYLSVGLVSQPGMMFDANNSAGWGNFVSLGYHHAVANSFFMAAELNLGAQWLDEHSANALGDASAEAAFALQFGVIGRWTPGEGPLFGGLGMHFYQAFLDDAPLYVMAFDLRFGAFIWQSDDDFILLEIGYAPPFIQGLNLPTEYQTPAPGSGPVEQEWSFHRAHLGLSWGF